MTFLKMRLSLLDVLNKTFILTVPNIQVDSFQAPQQPRNPKIEQVWNEIEIMIFQVKGIRKALKNVTTITATYQQGSLASQRLR